MGGRRRINIISNPANKEVPFFNDNIFPPYSIVMSHVAVENVHGLEQQVRRVLFFFFKKNASCIVVRMKSAIKKGVYG